jgi:hypothetical protein
MDAGTIAQWLTVAVIVFVGWRISRGGGSAALETLELANQVLERRVRDLEANAKADAATPLINWSESHEHRAQERHNATLGVLGLIADRLGPETNGAPT